MRIKCDSLDEFLDNLREAAVYRRIVHYSREREPLNGRTRADATSWDIWYRVSAVLEFEDGGQALLEAVEHCGQDRTTADGGDEGLRRQVELHTRLLDECRDRELRVLPGIVDLT